MNPQLPPAQFRDDVPAWTETVVAFLAEKERRSGSRRTVEGYARMIWPFLDRIGSPDRITPTHVLAWAHEVGASGREPSSATVGARIACFSSYFRFLIRMSIASSNPCDALERPRTVQSVARGLSADEVRRLLAVVPGTVAELRIGLEEVEHGGVLVQRPWRRRGPLVHIQGHGRGPEEDAGEVRAPALVCTELLPHTSGRLRSAMCAAAPSVDLVVRSEVHEEGLVALPAEEDAEVVVDAQRPVVGELALQLVGTQEWVTWIGGEASQCRANHRRLGLAELLCPAQEAARRGEPHR